MLIVLVWFRVRFRVSWLVILGGRVFCRVFRLW